MAKSSKLEVFYEGGVMYLNEKEAIKNGLKIFKDALKGNLRGE
jgi:hypothetical protein